MAILIIPEQQEIRDFAAIQTFLRSRGIALDYVAVPASVGQNASTGEITSAYRELLGPYMERNGYQTADVITLSPDMPEKEQIRAKFIREHTHSEDEVRCFVSGSGQFWFHTSDESGGEEVFSVLCSSGDLLSVPAGTKHWFDCGTKPDVTAIRIFTDRAGWVPSYTGSQIEDRYSL